MKIKVGKVSAIMLGVFMPLINIRFPLPYWSPSLFMFVIIGYVLLSFGSKKGITKLCFFDVSVLLFLFCIIASTLYSYDFEYGFLRAFKLFIVVSVYFLLSRAMVRAELDYSLLFKFVFISAFFYLCYLSYIYLLVFGVGYVGVITEYPTGENKNALAFVLVCIIPFLYGLFASKDYLLNNKFITWFFLVVIIISGLMILSRSLIVILIVYFFLILLSEGVAFQKMVSYFFIGAIVIIFGSRYIPDTVLTLGYARIESLVLLFNDNYQLSDVVSGANSISRRSDLLSKAIDVFTQYPLFGAGNGAFMAFPPVSLISHNDYALVIAEQGLIGLLIFLVLVSGFLYVAFINYRKSSYWIDLSALMAVIGVSINMFSNNIYDSIYLWFIYSVLSARYCKINSVNIYGKST